jgi:hypothetical protein
MTEAHQNSYKTQFLISSIVLIIGFILLVFMITVEGEPGALPLALVLVGSTWKLILNRKIKSSNLA